MRFRKILAGILAASMMISQTPANAQISSEKQIYNMLQDSSEGDTAPGEITAPGNVPDQGTSTETQTTENVIEDNQTTENITTEEVLTTESQSTEEPTEDVTTRESYTTENQTTDNDTTEEIKEEDWQDPENGDGIAELAADEVICTETDLTIDELRESASGKISVNGDAITITDATYMILLSHCKPEEIYKKDITISVTGDIDFTGTVKFMHNGEKKTYAYNSIGTEDYPFEGKVTIRSNIAKFDNAMFGVLSSNAVINCLSLIRKTTSANGQRPIIADEYRFADSGRHEIPFTSILVESVSDETGEYSTGGMFGKVTGESGTLVIQSGIAHRNSDGDTSGSVPVSVGGDAHVGLICGSLENGTIQLGAPTSALITFLDTYTITATGESADAGAMIGHMDEGTAFINYADLTLDNNKVTSASGNAGGLIGYMAKGADLKIGNNIAINHPTVEGYENAGGLAGFAKDIELINETESSFELTVSSPEVRLKKTSGATANGAGGVFGHYKNTAEGEVHFPDWVQIASSENEEISLLSYGSTCVESAGSLGGVFGLLELGYATTYIVQLGNLYCHRIGENEDNSFAGNYGAVAGCVKTENPVDRLGALKIIGKPDLSIVVADGGQRKISGNITSNAYYFGGLVGRIGYKENGNSHAAYLYVENVSIIAKSPFGKYEERGFGGAVGCIDEDSVLSMAGTVKIKTASGSNVTDKKIWEGGGLVGNAKLGSALELKGTTDLSEVTYADSYNYNAAQLVGIQDCALVYAHGDGNGNGWTLNRAAGTKNLTINDIGDYGEVLKLNTEEFSKGLDSDIISIDPSTHKVTVKQTKDIYLGDITVRTKEDFALLATTWQSRGYFSAYPDIDRNNFDSKNFNSKKLIFSGKIDLTDTGVQGLTRGYGDPTDSFNGTISGVDNAEIVLAIGQTYGKRNNALVTKDDKSSGQLYSWGNNRNGGRIYIGLFDKQSGAVSDLKISGCIYACALLAQKTTCYIGAIAGNLTGNATLDNVISSVSIYASVITDNTDHSKLLKVGGMYGSMPGNSNLTLDGNTTSLAEITVSGGTTDGHARIGGVIGNIDSSASNVTVDCNSATLSAKLTKSDGRNAYMGGLIGVIEPADSAKRTINVKDLTVSDCKIDTGKSTSGTCGGMLGYLWSNTDVNFEGTSNKPGLNVTSGTINAPASEVGGLVYHANGKWTVKDYGISMTGLSITGKISVGLLVNKADVRKEISINGDKDIPYVLYLEMQNNWTSAYKLSNITINGTPDVYDELVAYTTSAPEKIADNGVNAVISLATVADGIGRKGVDKEAGVCTTYQNQTAYGNGKTNGYSRYYYDLDKIINDVTTDSGNSSNSYIDTPEELMLWSVYNYAHNSIQSNFVFADCTKNGGVTIGSSSKPNAALDMKGYSYYPVIHSGDITVSYADITFYNKEIEAAEKTVSNKLTSGSDDNHSQHYMMHCGLFVKNDAGTAKVEEVSFAGSIGMVNGGSGALYTHSIAGTNSSKGVSVARLTINGMKLAGIAVNGGISEYAPVIINSVGSYAALDIQNVDYDKMKYSSVVAGSSFIGSVGSENATQISLAFSGITLPDKAVADGGIFTRASLLNSFSYLNDGTSVGTYNFYFEEDWNGSSHIHKVTYGSEISHSKEFDKELQKYYYNETPRTEVYGEDNNKNFSSYLPYVYTSYSDEAGYTHEIKVNQRVFDLVEGCGTYGHPYVITNQGYMDIVAEYIAAGSNAAPRKDWRVTIPKTQTTLCRVEERQDITYQYDGSVWKEVESQGSGVSKTWEYKTGGSTLENKVMYMHILSAYYDIQGSSDGDSGNELVLENFVGLGSSTYPFRGVVVSTLESGVTVRLKGSKTAGLINYSYGSVVRNLDISYEYADSETSGKKDTTTGKSLEYTTPDRYSPKSFFGGVIGCIMGGDNIIDGVTVSMDSGWLRLSENKKHLLQVGGYVGSICGGGVIFRNMKDETGLTDAWIQSETGIVDSKANLYVNPFVGRVLDGFAFSEGCSVDNKNKNYQINLLKADDEKCVYTVTAPSSEEVRYYSSNKVTVNNAQGLLVLSAVVNSGATGGGARNNSQYGTYAYWGNLDGLSDSTYQFGNGLYGKVRNATYEHVGKPELAGDDYVTALKDDRNAPGCIKDIRQKTEFLDKETNAPYLVTKYCNPATYYVSGQNRRTYVQFVEGKYDMTKYGLGYQGLGARYRTNALNAGDQVKADRVIPYISGVDGNNAELIVNMQVAEYDDDDFHAVSAGGLFNVLNPSATHKPSGVADNFIQNITISGSASDNTNTSGEISLTYHDAQGNVLANDLSESDWKNCERVSVGGLAGITAHSNIKKETEKIVNVKIQNLKLGGQVAAGGIIGTVNRTESSSDDIGALIGLSTGMGFRSYEFDDCSYENLKIEVNGDAGGLIGYAGSRIDYHFSITGGEYKNSSITSKDHDAGGLAASSSSRFYVNASSEGKALEKPNFVVLTDVTVKGKMMAGGVVGKLAKVSGSSSYARYYINSVKVISTNPVSVEANKYAGGIAGIIDSVDNLCTIEKCTVAGLGVKTTADTSYNGGIVGSIGTNALVTGCNISAITTSGNNNTNSGGVAGQIGGKFELSIVDTQIRGITIGKSKLGGGAVGLCGTSSKLYVKNFILSDEEDSHSTINSYDSEGGIVGCSAKDTTIDIDGCTIENARIQNGWYAGGIQGSTYGISGIKLRIKNCAVKGTIIASNKTGGNTSDTVSTGCIIGYQNGGSVQGSNVLLYDNTLTSTDNKRGIFSGKTGDTYEGLYIAGASIQASTPDKISSLPEQYVGGKENTVDNCYVAFADYSGASLNADENTKKNLLGITDASQPYVVKSPDSSLTVVKDGEEKKLFGDGACWASDSSAVTPYAKVISDDSENASEKTYRIYREYADKYSGKTFDFANNMSTYADNQTDYNGTNFPVLLISGGQTDVITQYMDILTNSGYSKVNNKYPDRIKASTEIYNYKNGRFECETDTRTMPALRVSNSSTEPITFTTSSAYDNDKNRFTLLTVTFTEAGQDYVVHVPIIVRRMLEVDFTATLNYGTHYNSAEYQNIENHVLDSFGNPMTGYLTYRYNSAKGKNVEYGWQNYVDAGADVAQPMDKVLIFNQTNALPAGTQLTIVDCQDPNRTAYYYTVTSADSTKKQFKLSNFKDSNGTNYKPESVGECMDITAAKNNDSGRFVETTSDSSDATVKIGDKYYRLATDEEKKDGTKDKFDMTVDDKVKTENYYFVVTMPELGADGKTNPPANGSIRTSLAVTGLPNHINYVLRKADAQGNIIDGQSNTASTYQISSGYSQSLSETLDNPPESKLLNESDTGVNVSIKDTISFPDSQAYNTSDQLYQRFVVSLMTTTKDVTGNLKDSYEQFPSGTKGSVSFYVYTETDSGKKYYTYNPETGSWGNQVDTKAAAVTYDWVSQGGNMELPLATDGKSEHAISLQPIRDSIQPDASGYSTICVEAVLNAKIPAAGLMVIPISSVSENSVPDEYAKLNYVAQISTDKNSLSYSSSRATLKYTETKVKYYRKAQQGAVFRYDADSIDQLGINMLDLDGNLDKDKKSAIISTTASYDLTNIQNLDEILKKSSGIRYTVKLVGKSDASGMTETYNETTNIQNASDYMTVNLMSGDSGTVEYHAETDTSGTKGTWSWTIPKSTYIDTDGDKSSIKKSAVFDGNTFTQAVNLYVNVDEESLKKIEGHMYSNYKVVMQVEILDASGAVVEKMTASDYVIYTFTRIKPEFVSN